MKMLFKLGDCGGGTDRAPGLWGVRLFPGGDLWFRYGPC